MFGVSYLFMVLLYVSVVETVLYSSLEGLEALAGTVSGWSDVVPPLRSVTAAISMSVCSLCAAFDGRFLNAGF